MSKKIDQLGIGSGRVRKENDVVVNTGDLLEQIAAGTGTAGTQELYGADVSTRPLATAVTVGTTFIVVADPIVVYMSDGTNWIEVA